jgi:hypothetical protein
VLGFRLARSSLPRLYFHTNFHEPGAHNEHMKMCQARGYFLTNKEGRAPGAAVSEASSETARHMHFSTGRIELRVFLQKFVIPVFRVSLPHGDIFYKKRRINTLSY